MSNLDNPRAVIGDNRAPDYAQKVADELREQYRETETRVTFLLDAAENAPKVVDEESMGVVAGLIRSIKDEVARLEALREAEKMPHYRAAQAVDSYFNPLKELLAAKNRTSKPGALDRLQRGLDDYNQAKLAAERERRRQEAEKAARIERERREAEERARREAEERRIAAEKARKDIEAKSNAAAEAEAGAAAAQAAADLASVEAESARIATLAKPADLVRTRTEQGPLVTMGTEPYAVIEDENALDRDVLWPFISTDAKERALRAWARTTNYSQPMTGARVGKRPKTVVR